VKGLGVPWKYSLPKVIDPLCSQDSEIKSVSYDPNLAENYIQFSKEESLFRIRKDNKDEVAQTVTVKIELQTIPDPTAGSS
jgi:hypothetical protein